MKQEKLSIRKAQIQDATEMARLSAEMGFPITAQQTEHRLGMLLPNPFHHILVASDTTASLLGWIHVEHRISIDGGQRAEIMGLVVDSRIRRKGIGRRLVDEAVDWANGRGLTQLAVRSNTVRETSHPFYASVGFVRRKSQHVYERPLGESPPTAC